MSTMKCKICGGEIEEIECCGMEVQEDRIIIEKAGRCKNCRAFYLWEDYFFFAKSTEPELFKGYDEDLDLDEEWGDDGNLECGFDPYLGCYSDDC